MTNPNETTFVARNSEGVKIKVEAKPKKKPEPEKQTTNRINKHQVR